MLLNPVGDVHALDVARLNDVGRVSGVRGPQVQVMGTLARRTKGTGKQGNKPHTILALPSGRST